MQELAPALFLSERHIDYVGQEKIASVKEQHLATASI
jgi:hypothetical protein